MLWVRSALFALVLPGTALGGEVVLLRSLWLLAWAAVVATGFHARVIGYEEPALRRQLGAAFDAILRRRAAVAAAATVIGCEAAPMLELEVSGDVRILRLREGENRFNRSFVDGIHAALDEVAAVDGPVALVTVGEGKFFSNGLDLEWMGAEGATDTGFLDDVHRMLQRVLALDVVTVAALNGHAFAGGAMLATAHDYRVMRADRGYWCLPEVDLGLPLTPVMYEVLAAHLPRPALADAALTGRRYSGPEALAAGIVTEVAAEADVLPRAVELAAALAGKDRHVIAEHKRLLYGLP